MKMHITKYNLVQQGTLRHQYKPGKNKVRFHVTTGGAWNGSSSERENVTSNKVTSWSLKWDRNSYNMQSID